MTAHRKPPMPGWPATAGGYCRWCAKPIWLEKGPDAGRKINRRRGWHDGRGDEPNCLGLYRIAAWPESARFAIANRGDPALCEGCAKPHGGQWEADHDTPLWLVDRTAPLEQVRWYFGTGNLKRLCLPCHKEKTATEAFLRAKAERNRKRRAGQKVGNHQARNRKQRGRARETEIPF